MYSCDTVQQNSEFAKVEKMRNHACIYRQHMWLYIVDVQAYIIRSLCITICDLSRFLSADKDNESYLFAYHVQVYIGHV